MLPSRTSLSFTPIGRIRTPFAEKAEAPRQAVVARDARGVVELDPGRGFEDALRDLEGWERLWVLFAFDRAEGWKPTVQPPRSDGKRGLFATRSPHRPNPIGMSCVELVRVEGLSVHVRGVDMLDGTPVLDLKPYVAYADAFPAARAPGWLGGVVPAAASTGSAAEAAAGGFAVAWSAAAAAQRAWLADRGVDLAPVETLLEASPLPHAYRRIKRDGSGFRLAYKAFRVWFTVEGRAVRVERVGTGHRASELASDPSLDLHRDFVRAFPAG